MANILNKEQEAALIAATKERDTEAFGSLYDTFVKKIYDFVYYKTLNKEVAEDIVSLVFTKAWQKINQFKSGSFSAWLYTIARNAIVDYYRRDRKNVDIDDCWDLSDESDFLAKVDTNLHLEHLRAALADLNSRERDILIMRFWQDLSFAEIAERLDKKEGAVKMACGRALQALKIKMPLAVFILLPGLINICKRTS
ncbi:MAG: RNA polymerase sigma factor [Patescibacteria group bacterium]|nr:RNA polymerase sigma factor [Patescibacteria group bacterium]